MMMLKEAHQQCHEKCSSQKNYQCHLEVLEVPYTIVLQGILDHNITAYDLDLLPPRQSYFLKESFRLSLVTLMR